MKKFLGAVLACTMLFSTAVFGAEGPTNIDKLAVTGVYDDKGAIGYQVTYGSGAVENMGVDGILIFVNGSIVERAGAIIENDSVLVPLRVISESLGAKVNWEKDTQKVTVSDSDTNIELTIGESIGKLNGADYSLAVAPKIINDSTYVPLRFISEGLKAEAAYSDGQSSDVPYMIDGLRQVMISKYSGDTIEIGRQRAIERVYEDLVYAYEKRFERTFEPINEALPTGVYPGDEEGFRYIFLI